MKILVEFKCGHFQDVKEVDVLRTVARCGACGLTRAIHNVVTLEWMCRCYDCRFKMWCGADEESARDGARRHGNKNPQHRPTYAKASRPKSRQLKDAFHRKLHPGN